MALRSNYQRKHYESGGPVSNRKQVGVNVATLTNGANQKQNCKPWPQKNKWQRKNKKSQKAIIKSCARTLDFPPTINENFFFFLSEKNKRTIVPSAPGEKRRRSPSPSPRGHTHARTTPVEIEAHECRVNRVVVLRGMILDLEGRDRTRLSRHRWPRRQQLRSCSRRRENENAALTMKADIKAKQKCYTVRERRYTKQTSQVTSTFVNFTDATEKRTRKTEVR